MQEREIQQKGQQEWGQRKTEIPEQETREWSWREETMHEAGKAMSAIEHPVREADTQETRAAEIKRERSRLCADSADELRGKGLYAESAALYERAADLSERRRRKHRMQFTALSCYLKAEDYVAASRLVKTLRESRSMSEDELKKLESISRAIRERMGR